MEEPRPVGVLTGNTGYLVQLRMLDSLFWEGLESKDVAAGGAAGAAPRGQGRERQGRGQGVWAGETPTPGASPQAGGPRRRAGRGGGREKLRAGVGRRKLLLGAKDDQRANQSHRFAAASTGAKYMDDVWISGHLARRGELVP